MVNDAQTVSSRGLSIPHGLQKFSSAEALGGDNAPVGSNGGPWPAKAPVSARGVRKMAQSGYVCLLYIYI